MKKKKLQGKTMGCDGIVGIAGVYIGSCLLRIVFVFSFLSSFFLRAYSQNKLNIFFLAFTVHHSDVVRIAGSYSLDLVQLSCSNCTNCTTL